MGWGLSLSLSLKKLDGLELVPKLFFTGLDPTLIHTYIYMFVHTTYICMCFSWSILIHRKILKETYNPHFGSIFRTERGPTYFSRRLMRFASLYTSSVSNFLNLSLDHAFYSRRSSLPHEPDINFDSWITSHDLYHMTYHMICMW